MISRSLMFAVVALLGLAAGANDQQTWMFNQISSLDGLSTQVLGHPEVIQAPFGPAIHFDGVEDAIFVPVHPLAGAKTWTWEVIFKPDADGAPAQRFFHLSVVDPATGKDLDDRMLFEIRIVNGQWCLDSFAMTGTQSKALLNCEKLHAFGPWYRVTAVYDGKTLRNYVGDELQGQGDVDLAVQGTGRSSVGVRVNLKDYFKGSIYEARFTRHALSPADFLKLPHP
jgi:hypothetical protein